MIKVWSRLPHRHVLSMSLKDFAKCSTIPCENISPSVLLGDENLNNTYVSRDSRTSCNCKLVPPFIKNKHIQPFGICYPKYQCYLNFMIQALLPILRTIIHNFQLNPSTEGSLSKCLFETTHSASNSTDVDALKLWRVQYYTFYNGKIQQDSWECLMMLIEVINRGSVPYCRSNDDNFTCHACYKNTLSVMYVD